MSIPPWQAQVMSQSRRAELLSAAHEARLSGSVGPVHSALRSAVTERAGEFLIRKGERLRRDAVRNRPLSAG